MAVTQLDRIELMLFDLKEEAKELRAERLRETSIARVIEGTPPDGGTVLKITKVIPTRQGLVVFVEG